jgi:tetratricopeptide (TPR) repeat protein
MSSKKMIWFLIISLGFSVSNNAIAAEPTVEDLLNPQYMAATLCGRGGEGHTQFFKIPQRFAMSDLIFWEDEDLVQDGVVLWDTLGDREFRVSTSNPTAQQYYNQGMRLVYNFNHMAAIQSFKAAQTLDPSCAMCFWGEALAWGPNINLPMQPEFVAPAFSAITKAQELAPNASAKEQAYISALAKRYRENPPADRSSLDKAFADAMREITKAHPDDLDAAALFAESLMDISPWDYWARDHITPKGNTEEILETIDRILAADPDHPAAIHLLIHTVEASTTPDRAVAAADRLAEQMPGAGHLVHMPSHIYYRVGRFKDSIEANSDAAEADEKFFKKTPDSGVYAFGYYPHNVHFLMASALMAGDKRRAIRSAEKLAGLIPDEFAAVEVTSQPIKAAALYAHALFSDPETILAQEKPGDIVPLIQVIWHYARGIAYTQLRDFENARAEGLAIEGIRESGFLDPMVERLVPGVKIARVAEHVLAGRIAQATGQKDEAVEQFGKAVEVQDDLNYTEPPYWYYPVRQSLGIALLSAGDPEEAIRVLQRSLVNYPNNAWALYGLMQAYKAVGETDAAKVTEKLFKKAWSGPGDVIELGRI